MRIGGRHGGGAIRRQAALLASRHVHVAPRLPGAADAHAPFLHAELATPALLAHTEARGLRLDIAQPRAHDEGTRMAGGVRHRMDGDLAGAQAQQARRIVEQHVDGAGGIQVQRRAVGQDHVAPLAGGAPVVGAPVQGIGPPGSPANRRGHDQGNQRLERGAAALEVRSIQRCHAQRRRNEAEARIHALRPLPGMFVLGLAGAPLVAGMDVRVGSPA